MKLSCHDRSDWLLSMMKTRQDNDMINHIGAIYAKNDIELSWPNGSSVDCDENYIRQLHG